MPRKSKLEKLKEEYPLEYDVRIKWHDTLRQLKKAKLKIGFTCSSFDLLHAGHLIMLEDASKQCDRLVVGLQSDPTIDRPSKNKPIQTFEERYMQLLGVKYIDEIVPYDTEEDLLKLLKHSNFDIRILGSDWEGKNYTGKELDIPVYFHTREHKYSTSELRKRIYLKEKGKRKK